VLLQAMKEDPPPDARCRDKFLVQSVAITPNKDSGNVSQIWSNIEQSAKASIQEKKIRVSFLPAGGFSDNTTAASNGIPHHQDDEPPSYASPSPSVATPQRNSTQAPSGPISSPSDRPADAKSRGDAVESAHNPATDNSTLGAIRSAIPTSSDDMKRQLETANAKVMELQQQMTEGLRQRRAGAAEGGEKMGTTSGGNMGLHNAPAPGGVPVQYVAALCLLCFLIAWLFF